LETEIFEIETNDCTYASFAQPTARPLAAGDSVALELWHLQLWAPVATTGHIAVMIDDWLVWEQAPAIPGSATHFAPTVVVPRSIPAGSRVVFHLHNHGTNSYRLYRIDRVPH
jgi:hypothetical protein